MDITRLRLVRFLNLLQYWYIENAEEKDYQRIRSAMGGPLETTLTKPISKPGKPRPWWFGNDEEVSAGNMAAMMSMKQQKR